MHTNRLQDRNQCARGLIAVLFLSLTAWPGLAGLRLGAFDATRQGAAFNLETGTNVTHIRASIQAAFPGVSIVSFPTLTDEALASVDIIFLFDITADSVAITPLSAAEQQALRTFILAGGGAIILADNDSFAGPAADPANESMVDIYGIDATGTSNPWPVNVTIPHPADSPLTRGPFGQVNNLSVGWSGWFDNIGPYATVIGTLDQNNQPVVLAVKCDVLASCAGVSLIFGDSTWVVDGFYETNPGNEVLLLNAIAYTNRARTCDGDTDGNSIIDLVDLALLLAEYGTSAQSCCLDGDVDRNGVVNLSDLSAVLARYGTTCP